MSSLRQLFNDVIPPIPIGCGVPRRLKVERYKVPRRRRKRIGMRDNSIRRFEVKVRTMDHEVSKQMADQNEQQQQDEQCGSGFKGE